VRLNEAAHGGECRVYRMLLFSPQPGSLHHDLDYLTSPEVGGLVVATQSRIEPLFGAQPISLPLSEYGFNCLDHPLAVRVFYQVPCGDLRVMLEDQQAVGLQRPGLPAAFGFQRDQRLDVVGRHPA